MCILELYCVERYVGVMLFFNQHLICKIHIKKKLQINQQSSSQSKKSLLLDMFIKESSDKPNVYFSPSNHSWHKKFWSVTILSNTLICHKESFTDYNINAGLSNVHAVITFILTSLKPSFYTYILFQSQVYLHILKLSSQWPVSWTINLHQSYF